MAISHKGMRKIVVDNHTYVWKATGREGWTDLVVASAELKGPVCVACFDYYPSQNSKRYYTVTPYVVRQTILHANEKGFSWAKGGKDLHLGNMTKAFWEGAGGERKVKKLLRILEQAATTATGEEKSMLVFIVREGKSMVSHGEWYVGFENMITNLDEMGFKFSPADLNLVKEIFAAAQVDWKVDWAWIAQMQAEK